jgi:rRNA maturation endonuclease Nob1
MTTITVTIRIPDLTGRLPAVRQFLGTMTTPRTRVLAIQCVGCGQWVKPRHIQPPRWLCDDCGHAAYLAARQRLRARVQATAGGHR